MFEWFYSGVNTTIPRSAGPECVNYLSGQRKIVETIITTGILAILYRYSRKSIRWPDNDKKGYKSRPTPVTQKVLLFIVILVWGMEIGYKLSNHTLVNLLNPCHPTTAIQVNRFVPYLFI